MAGRSRPDGKLLGKRMEAKLNCAASTLKYILFAFNFVFLVGGLAVLIIGAVILASIGDYDVLLSDSVSVPGIMLVIAGCLIVVVSFLGCCGALRQSVWMLMTFACIMVVIFILQLTGGILSFVFQDGFGSAMEKEMENLMRLYSDEENGEVARKTWDEMQINLECCGIDGYGDWQVIAGIETPRSCQCFSEAANCNPAGSFREGCYNSLKDYFASIQSALGIVAIIFAVVELVGAAFALIVAYTIKRNAELPSYSGRGASNPYHVRRRTYSEE